MRIRNFLAELKRRDVYKVAVAYAVVAWLVIQIATQVFPFFEIPNWAVRLVVLLLILGFPVALILAWAFEITPEGIKLEKDVAPSESSRPRTGRKLVGITIALAVIAAGLLAFQLLRPKSAVTAVAAETSVSGVAAVPDKSIAVLPFDNLSRDPDNAYFAEGIQDEILARLSKIADLKVISRTSTQKYKSAPDNLRAIAQQLGVANILEGSVQKANDQVRVNVQLINATNDAHLWADIYDRKLTDIFAVESEIAKTIADTLQAKLSGSELKAMAKVPTQNSEAYELYLKGRFFWNKRTGTDLRKAIGYFDQAISKDPNYALAYAGLADSYLLLPAYGAASPRDSIPQAKAAAKKALELDNTLAEAHASAGLLSSVDFEFDRSITEFERAIQLNPNYATAYHWLAIGPLLARAQLDRAIVEEKRAVELDPLSLIINADLSWVYFDARRYDEAIAQARKTIEIDPRFFLAHLYLGMALQLKGQLAEAIPEYQKSVELENDPVALAFLGQARVRNGQAAEAQNVLARLTEEAKSRYVPAYGLAVLFNALGDTDRAMDALERAYREGATEISGITIDPMLDDLRAEPRFDALVQKILAANR